MACLLDWLHVHEMFLGPTVGGFVRPAEPAHGGMRKVAAGNEKCEKKHGRLIADEGF